MTNEAILDVLNQLRNEARNAALSAFGLIELHRVAAEDPTLQESLDLNRNSADRVVQSIDDFRELLSGITAAPGIVEEFDLDLCLRETIEMLNLTSGEQAAQVRRDAAIFPVIVLQDRQAVEQVILHALYAASMLTRDELRVGVRVSTDGIGGQLTIATLESEVAARLARWLNTGPEQVHFESATDVVFGVAAMVAGGRIRALGGKAELVGDAMGPKHLAICVPSRSEVSGATRSAVRYPIKEDALNILVTEDSDESFALTELLLPGEHVWRARDGFEALDIVKQRRFDVVFMDVHMDGMDGYTTIRTIRDWETVTSNARTPIVILSSDDLATQHRSAAQCGCSGFLRKPVDDEAMRELLERLKATRAVAS